MMVLLLLIEMESLRRKKKRGILRGFVEYGDEEDNLTCAGIPCIKSALASCSRCYQRQALWQEMSCQIDGRKESGED
jgi:hypothetical protein